MKGVRFLNTVIDFKEKYIESIDRKAYELYSAVKFDDGIYSVADNNASFANINEDFKYCKPLNEKEIVQSINSLKTNMWDCLMVRYREGDNGNKIIEVCNLSEEKMNSIEFVIKDDLNNEMREMIVNMIAYYHMKNNVIVVFFLHYDFDVMVQLIKNKAT